MEKKLILVVEDVQLCQDFIKLLFNANPNYEIISAYNCNRALEEIKRFEDKIVLIILDHSLPDILGLELFNIIQANLKLRHIPVIFQSGYNLEAICNLSEIIETKKNITKIEILSKPYSKEQLFEKISLVLGKDWNKKISRNVIKTNISLKIKS